MFFFLPHRLLHILEIFMLTINHRPVDGYIAACASFIFKGASFILFLQLFYLTNQIEETIQSLVWTCNVQYIQYIQITFHQIACWQKQSLQTFAFSLYFQSHSTVSLFSRRKDVQNKKQQWVGLRKCTFVSYVVPTPRLFQWKMIEFVTIVFYLVYM